MKTKFPNVTIPDEFGTWQQSINKFAQQSLEADEKSRTR